MAKKIDINPVCNGCDNYSITQGACHPDIKQSANQIGFCTLYSIKGVIMDYATADTISLSDKPHNRQDSAQMERLEMLIMMHQKPF